MDNSSSSLVIDQPGLCEKVQLGEGIEISFLNDSSIQEVEEYENLLGGSHLDIKDDINKNGMKDKLCNGLYARTLFIPKGTFLTGQIHSNDYIDIFIHGDVTVKSYFADGTIEAAERVNSFRYFDGKAGRKRVLVAHEDTLWVTVDPTGKDNIEDAENEVLNPQCKDFLARKKELNK